MNRPYRRSGPWSVAGILLLAGCGSTEFESPPPEVTAELDTAAVVVKELPPSYVAAPIVFDLRPVLAELEAKIPTKVGSIEKDKRIQVKKGTPDVWVAPELTRGPLQFSFEKNTVTVAAEFEYRARAWVKPLLATYSVSCGVEGPKPRIRLRLKTAYDLSPDWHLKTRSELLDLSAVSQSERDQCELSAAKINVTKFVTDAATGALTGALAKLDEKISTISIAKPIGGIWKTLQRPIGIAQGTLWLHIQPKSISLGDITANDSSITARLALLAQPRMLSGTRPPDGTLPLPALGRGVAGSDTAMVMLEGLLLYEAGTRLLGKALVGQSFGPRWRRAKVTSLVMAPAGRGRVLLSVGLQGRAKGIVHVIARPAYDSASGLITVDSLGFDVQTQSSVQRAAGWLIGGPLLGMIEERAKIPASVLMAEALEAANKNLNRQLTDGVFLRGNLTDATPLSVRATRLGLAASAKANGRLWVEISKEHLIPAKGQAAGGKAAGGKKAD
jgi:hypothetical protein